MNKALLIKQIIDQLEASLVSVTGAANAAHETATHEESVAENKYDTFGLEASYLAEGLSRQVQELRVAIQCWRNAHYPESRDGVIRCGSLITLENEDGEELVYFLGPAGGGIEIRDGERICRVITPSSPLGQALLNREEDDDLTLTIRGEKVTLSVISVH